MNINDNNARFFRIDVQLRYHWRADSEILTIINRRKKSAVTTELVKEGSNLQSQAQWDHNGTKIWVEKSTYQEGQKKTRGETSNVLISNWREKKESPTSTEVTSKILETRYRKGKHKNIPPETKMPEKMKPTEIRNPPPPTTLKTRWRHTSPGPTQQNRSRNIETDQ